MNPNRPSRCRPVPPHVADAVRDTRPGISEASLVAHLGSALAALPPDERAAVVAAVGYDEGAVGAAMEVEVEPKQAEQLARSAVRRLRAALADLPDDPR